MMVLVPQRFRHLGGSGLWLDAGSQRCSVTGSHFTDLSGAGVMVGGIGDPAQDNASLFTAANTVSGNTIVNVSREYHGTAALIVGYATGTTLSHNLIANVSYSGISLSWGWGAPSYAGNNHITSNHIHHTMCAKNWPRADYDAC